jgi:hypothetical protein
VGRRYLADSGNSLVVCDIVVCNRERGDPDLCLFVSTYCCLFHAPPDIYIYFMYLFGVLLYCNFIAKLRC